jgi:hypothetical protein
LAKRRESTVSKRNNGEHLTRDFTLGGEQAEADPLLQLAFYESGDYAAISSRVDPHCFVIGRTGGGKSAAFRRLEETQDGRVVRVNPEDLSLPYITELGAVKYLDALNVHLDPLFIALWKHVLVVELIRHRYRVDSPEAKQNFLTTLRERIRRDPTKQAALEYLDDFQGRFWCETVERVREIMHKFDEQITKEAGGKLNLPGTLKVEGERKRESREVSEDRVEQTDRFQRLVNETQLSRLNQMIKVLDEDILDEQHFTYVVIDDLDRDWVDERVANDLVRCLFRAVLDMKRVDNLKIIVALRTNIFDQLHFGSRSGAQEEKFRSLALHMRWTKNDLVEMLNERVRIAGEMFNASHLRNVHNLLPAAQRDRDPIKFILNRTLMRPRDAIAYINAAIPEATGKKRLTWDHLKAVETGYSHKRLLALRDEWKGSFPDIQRVFQLFERSESPMTRDAFSERLESAAVLGADPSFKGVRWVTEMTAAIWGGSSEDWFELYQPLTRLLYRIGFIGCSRFKGTDPIFAYEDMEFPERASHLGPDCLFFIHPTFHATLDIKRSNQRRPD